LKDETVAGNYELGLYVKSGGPLIRVKNLLLVVHECLATTITPTTALVSKQIATVGAAEMRFKISKYT